MSIFILKISKISFTVFLLNSIFYLLHLTIIYSRKEHIKQILNYARKSRPSEECADMLGADPSFVDLVYAQFHKDHGANASKTFDFLKADGKI